jgi:hypothetical protein
LLNKKLYPHHSYTSQSKRNSITASLGSIQKTITLPLSEK